MVKIVGDWSTDVKLTNAEAETICRFGQREKTCAFIYLDKDGFGCMRMVSELSAGILDRLKKGTINAKGEGGWEGCAWEGQV